MSWHGEGKPVAVGSTKAVAAASLGYVSRSGGAIEGKQGARVGRWRRGGSYLPQEDGGWPAPGRARSWPWDAHHASLLL